MLEIIGDRQTGKTTALVAVFLQDDSDGTVLAVPSTRLFRPLCARWPSLERRHLISHEALSKYVDGKAVRIYIDEIQMLPADFPLHRVIVATKTKQCIHCGHDSAPGYCCEGSKP